MCQHYSKLMFPAIVEKCACGYVRERPLMMSDFRGDGGSEMTPKNRILEGKNRTLGGDGRVKNRRDIING